MDITSKRIGPAIPISLAVVVEAVNGNIRLLINRGRGYKNLRYLLLKVKRLAVSNVEFIAVRSVKKAA